MGSTPSFRSSSVLPSGARIAAKIFGWRVFTRPPAQDLRMARVVRDVPDGHALRAEDLGGPIRREELVAERDQPFRKIDDAALVRHAQNRASFARHSDYRDDMGPAALRFRLVRTTATPRLRLRVSGTALRPLRLRGLRLPNSLP